MNLHFGKMSRRKQAKPNRLNEDEENDSAVFNGKILLLLLASPHYWSDYGDIIFIGMTILQIVKWIFIKS